MQVNECTWRKYWYQFKYRRFSLSAYILSSKSKHCSFFHFRQQVTEIIFVLKAISTLMDSLKKTQPENGGYEKVCQGLMRNAKTETYQ